MMGNSQVKTVAVLGFLLSGCVGPFDFSNDSMDKAESVIDQNRSVFADISTMRRSDPRFDINVSDGIWVSTETELADSMLPESFLIDRNDYVTGDALSLAELTAYLSSRLRIKVGRAPELVAKDDNVEDFVSVGVGEPQVAGTSSSGSDDATDRLADFIRTPKYRLNILDATTEEVLDSIAMAMGISWRFSQDKGVTFYYFETGEFTIAKTGDGGSLESSSATESSGESEDSTATSNVSGALTIAPNFWENTRSVIDNMVSDQGRVLFNEATGQVVVTDHPDRVRDVENYIDRLNRSLRLKARVNLVVARLSTSRSNGFNLNLDAVYRQSEDTLISLASRRPDFSSLSTLAVENIDPNSSFVGSQVFIDALKTQGEVSVVRSKSFVLRNHSVFSISKGDILRFVGEVSQTNTSDVGSTESSEIEELFIGFGMGFYTRILDKSRAVFNVMLDQSDFEGFEDLQIATDRTSRVPQTSKEHVVQEYEMRSGESQVLLAFDLSSGRDTKERNGGCLFGCNRSSSEEQEYLLYIMTVGVE